MSPLWLFFLFLLGLAVGSFINVLSIRYEAGAFVFRRGSLLGRSRCPHCKKTLQWFELMPLVSFALQLGRCRGCRALISWQYPIVELVTGVLFAAIPARLEKMLQVSPRLLFGEGNFFDYALVLWLAFSAVLVLIAVIDFRERVIPDELNIFVAGLGIVYVAVQKVMHAFGPIEGSLFGKYALLLQQRSDVFLNHAVAAFAALIFFAVIIGITRGKAMGMGDLKLAGAAGIFLGWPDIVFSLAFGFIVGALASVVLLAGRRKTMKDAVPFAPFIVAGIFLAFFAGQEILEWYFGIFQL